MHCRRRSRVVAVVAIASLLAGPTTAVLGASVSAVAHRLEVTGYATDSTPRSTIDAQAPGLTTLGVDGVAVASSGDGVAPPSSGARQLLGAAHAQRLRAVLLVANATDSGFSTAIAARLLSSSVHRAHVASALVRIVREQGWNGITVDIEALAANDAAGLVAFVARLRALLPRRDLLAVDVSATPSLGDYAQNGYRLASLARVSVVVLMAYDESGPWSGPGPIGGLPWQRASVAAARRVVPASRLVLGVAAYGYTWPPGARVHDGVTVTDVQARDLAADAHRTPRWVGALGEWTVRLRDGTVLWWSDARSFALRRALALRDGLAGLAVWQLSSSDPLPRR